MQAQPPLRCDRALCRRTSIRTIRELGTNYQLQVFLRSTQSVGPPVVRRRQSRDDAISMLQPLRFIRSSLCLRCSTMLELAPGAVLLPRFVAESAKVLIDRLKEVVTESPFRRMMMPGGFPMSVEMTNCGTLGWITDNRCYRYEAGDPLTGSDWPAMPRSFSALPRTPLLKVASVTLLPTHAWVTVTSQNSS
jgi:hypothetical protein